MYGEIKCFLCNQVEKENTKPGHRYRSKYISIDDMYQGENEIRGQTYLQYAICCHDCLQSISKESPTFRKLLRINK